MPPAEIEQLRFVPTKVKGRPDVTEVIVYPNRLELYSDGQWVTIRFTEIVHWFKYAWFYRLQMRLGFGLRGWPCVADRDWFKPQGERYFRFFSSPPLEIYLPGESDDVDYADSLFYQIQAVISRGRFSTSDLG